MAILVIAEHDNQSVKAATLNTVSAAGGGEQAGRGGDDQASFADLHGLSFLGCVDEAQ